MEVSCIYQLPDENINENRNYFPPDYQQLIRFVEKYFQKPLRHEIAGFGLIFSSACELRRSNVLLRL